MNPNACRVVLRPRGPFEVLDLALRLTRVRWRPILGLGVVVLGPPWVLLTVLSWLADGHWALFFVPVALAPALQAPFTLLVGRLLFADDVSVREVLRDVVLRTPALMAAWGAFAAGLLASVVTCFYGIPFVQGALLYISEAALLEQVDIARGASRSLRLAGAGAGQTIAGLMVRWGSLFWFALAAEAVGQALFDFVLQVGQPFGGLWTTGAATPFVLGGLLVAQPAWAIYRLLLYVDVRTRIEGWDLQVGLWAAARPS